MYVVSQQSKLYLINIQHLESITNTTLWVNVRAEDTIFRQIQIKVQINVSKCSKTKK